MQLRAECRANDMLFELKPVDFVKQSAEAYQALRSVLYVNQENAKNSEVPSNSAEKTPDL
jgi:hypothetical protein